MKLTTVLSLSIPARSVTAASSKRSVTTTRTRSLPTIDINSERAQYWIGVGAQPTESVLAQLKITGDWQAAKGLEGGSTLKTVEKVDPQKAREDAIKAVQDEAEKRRAEKAKAREEAEAKAAAEAEETEEA